MVDDNEHGPAEQSWKIKKVKPSELHNNTRVTKKIKLIESYMMAKQNKQYLDPEFQKNIDSVELKRTIDGLHPRKFDEDDNLEPVGLFEATGHLNSSQARRNCFEYNNRQIAIYFKLLKSLGAFFFVISIVCVGLISYYSIGNFDVNSLTRATNMKISIGNLGATNRQCHQANLLI